MLKPIAIALILSAFVATLAADASIRSLANERRVSCINASLDDNIFAAGLGHNSFDVFYRNPFGAVKTSQDSIALRFRTCANDVERVRIRLWNSVEAKEYWYSMQEDGSETDGTLGPIQYWQVNLPIPKTPTLLFYFFEITDGHDTHYYVDDNPAFLGGGWGQYSEIWDDLNTYQITVYDKSFSVPDWLKGSVIYQIFPDRFRNGNKANDPENGTGFVFGKKIRKLEWNQPLCDPRGDSCKFESDNQFYGGDLEGVIEKLDDLKNLGVDIIYFNPIFQAASNHRYDTHDYLAIDEKLGNIETFEKLIREAEARGIRIVLDGVFNHVSADSIYFDLYRRYRSAAPGACTSPASPFRSWFYFPHYQNIPQDHNRPGTIYYCSGEGNSLTTYEAWAGFFELPVLNKTNSELRNFFYAGGSDSVARHWLREGAAGWRLDVATDVGKGFGIEPLNNFWRGFRKAIKTEKTDSVMIAEEWGDASPLLLGNEMDTTMNYRLRSAILNWMSDGCVGLGCRNDVFEDEDNNAFSSGGVIAPISETEFEARIHSIQEDYPPEAWHSAMNLMDSHDTSRVLFTLKKISRDNSALAIRKLKFLTLFLFTYPGAPTIYYGDEAGVADASIWYNGRWRDDPYTRAVYPWEDQGLKPDLQLIEHYKKLTSIRHSDPVFQTGNYMSLVTDSAQRLLAFSRADRAVIVLNRDPLGKHSVSFNLPKAFGTSAVFEDVLNGGEYNAVDGRLNAGSINPLWGKILIRKW